MKVCELSGAMLDMWVARAEGKCYTTNPGVWGNAGINELGRLSIAKSSWDCAKYFEPSKNWTHAGPIIERERIGIEPWDDGRTGAAIWVATTFENRATSLLSSQRSKSGATPLVAAMRCYVASKFGEEVPDEVTA